MEKINIICLILSGFACLSVFLLRFLRIDLIDDKIRDLQREIKSKYELVNVDIRYLKGLDKKKDKPKMPDFGGLIDKALDTIKNFNKDEGDLSSIMDDATEKQKYESQIINLEKAINEKDEQINELLDTINVKNTLIELQEIELTQFRIK